MIDFEKLEEMLDEALDKETKESLENFMKDDKPKFAVECFIRKNTQELRNKLNELGYHICSCTEFEDSKWLETFSQLDYPTVHGVGYWDETCPFEPHQALDFFVKENTTRETPSIDCGENEDLFLAIAALRDDTDKYQYFICDKVSFALGKTYYPDDYLYYQYDEFFDKQNWHKATVEELIAHFK